MPDNWKDAIIQVLRDHAEPLHYADIAEAIVEQRLTDTVGATPPEQSAVRSQLR